MLHVYLFPVNFQWNSLRWGWQRWQGLSPEPYTIHLCGIKINILDTDICLTSDLDWKKSVGRKPHILTWLTYPITTIQYQTIHRRSSYMKDNLKSSLYACPAWSAHRRLENHNVSFDQIQIQQTPSWNEPYSHTQLFISWGLTRRKSTLVHLKYDLFTF